MTRTASTPRSEMTPVSTRCVSADRPSRCLGGTVIDVEEEQARMVDRRRDPGHGEGRRRRLTRLRLGICAVAVAVIVSSVVLAVSYSGVSPTVRVLNIPVPRVDLANVIPGAPSISMASLRGHAVVVNFLGIVVSALREGNAHSSSCPSKARQPSGLYRDRRGGHSPGGDQLPSRCWSDLQQRI